MRGSTRSFRRDVLNGSYPHRWSGASRVRPGACSRDVFWPSESSSRTRQAQGTAASGASRLWGAPERGARIGLASDPVAFLGVSQAHLLGVTGPRPEFPKHVSVTTALSSVVGYDLLRSGVYGRWNGRGVEDPGRWVQRAAGLRSRADHLPPTRLLGPYGPAATVCGQGQGERLASRLLLLGRARAQSDQAAARRRGLAAVAPGAPWSASATTWAPTWRRPTWSSPGRARSWRARTGRWSTCWREAKVSSTSFQWPGSSRSSTQTSSAWTPRRRRPARDIHRVLPVAARAAGE